MSNVIIWLIVVAGAMGVAILALISFKRINSEAFSRFGQGIAGIAAAGGILAGGALFIAEGRTQPRLLLQMTSTVVGTKPGRGSQDAVYVQVVTTIENQGLLSPATIRCAAFDAFGITPDVARGTVHANDLALRSLLGTASDHGRNWVDCLRLEAQQAGSGHVQATSGFRWDNFQIRPGQIKTRNYELLVPCTLSGIRALVKIPDPTGGVLERKFVVSIASVCSGEMARDVTTVADPDPPPPPVSTVDSSAPERSADAPTTANTM